MTPGRGADGEPMDLLTGVERLPRVGASRARALAGLGVTNLGRLLAHLPARYERVEAESTIAKLAALPRDSVVSARGEVSATRVVQRRPRPRFEAVLVDGTGRLDLVWFNALYLRQKIQVGMRLRVQGKARRFGYGLQMANPTWEVAGEEEGEPRGGTWIRPVYPASEEISSRQIEEVVSSVLGEALPLIEDHLTPEQRRRRELPELSAAYRMLHAPETEAEVSAGRRRLAYDELLLLQLGVAMRRRHLRDTLRAPALGWSEAIDRHIRQRLPHTLTSGQEAVVRDIVGDLTSPTPTNRLIQGDVGSGKTLVALYAMLMAVAAGQQAAMMAPTEILAEQHFASIDRMLAGSRVRLELLTGASSGAAAASEARSAALGRIERGEVDIIVGTHALLSERVRFASLGVAVIDEQHRFGVHQRARLRSKGTREEGSADATLTPHVLVMTATPIPRTLGITLFGDLDISTIQGLPPGRQPVVTRVVGTEKRGEVYSWVRTRVEAGERAFVVVPAIDSESASSVFDPDGEGAAVAGAAPAAGLVDVRATLDRLGQGELAGLRLAALHGRMARATREAAMERFRSGAIDVLVATTVVEVGVDVPEATVMVVEQADRFGLAQLHQLRGRVGRGGRRSFCVLIADPVTEDGRLRLEAVASTTDGFALAERDFELRGPGELFGTRQSGLPPLRVANLMRDLDLLKLARGDAAEWIARSPDLDQPSEALLRRRLLKAYGAALGLGDVG